MFLLAASSTSPREPVVFDASPLVFLDLLGYVSFLQRPKGKGTFGECTNFETAQVYSSRREENVAKGHNGSGGSRSPRTTAKPTLL
jgi:hypothetical protein